MDVSVPRGSLRVALGVGLRLALGVQPHVALGVSDSFDPMDCSLPGSSVHGIFQARILEWVAFLFSRGQ